MMDILKLGEVLGPEREADLVIEAVRRRHAGLQSTVEEYAKISQQEAAAGSWSDETREDLRWAARDRRNYLELLWATTGGGWDGNSDYLVDWLEVDRVREERRPVDELFRGDRGDPPQPEVLALPAPAPARAQVFDPSHRRGRPSQYSWPAISAEMTRHCMAEPPTSQKALEDHVLNWCSENFGNEPAVSTVRNWVGPTWKAIQAATAADNSERTLPAATT